jgi:hypothetical protein
LKLSHLDQSLLAAGQSTPIWMNRFWPLGEPITKFDTLPLLLASPFVEHEAEPSLGRSERRITLESGCSAERESVGINSRIQELNCERAVTYHIVLSDKLIQTLTVDDALTVRIGVGAVIRARCISVNGHAKSYWFAVCAGSQDEMQIAGVKPIHNTATHTIEDRIFTSDRPSAR